PSQLALVIEPATRGARAAPGGEARRSRPPYGYRRGEISPSRPPERASRGENRASGGTIENPGGTVENPRGTAENPSPPLRASGWRSAASRPPDRASKRCHRASIRRLQRAGGEKLASRASGGALP